MRYPTLFLLGTALSIGSCSHRSPTATVELIDTSLSISHRAEVSVLNAVRKQIEEMERGDRLILIPVTGDAKNDEGGRVLRLEAPKTREPYDTDLKRFRAEADNEFSAWAAMHGAESGRTDLLGSIEVARQEIGYLPTGLARRLIIASDFIEDDGGLRFESDPQLGDAQLSGALAAQLRTRNGSSFAGTAVCLGRLESADFGALRVQRRQAIDAFWASFFDVHGQNTDIEIDGIGLLENPSRACPPANLVAREVGGIQ